MIKSEIISQLENVKNNYILGLSAVSLFLNEKVYPILEENNYVIFGNYKVGTKQVKNLLIKHADRSIALKEFTKSQIRIPVKESFEIIKNYCYETNQISKFRAESWYHFIRMIRNCLSHNCKFEFSEYDKRFIPVSWNNRIINSEMDGKCLELEFFGYVETWELFSECKDFVVNRLS